MFLAKLCKSKKAAHYFAFASSCSRRAAAGSWCATWPGAGGKVPKKVSPGFWGQSFSLKRSGAWWVTATIRVSTHSLFVQGYSQSPSKTSLFEVPKEIEQHYASNHTPVGIKREWAPPYTDTKALEDLKEIYKAHLPPRTFGDKLAFFLVQMIKPINHLFFRDKYTHHAVVLETVAAVPGMVAGMLRHFRSLRTMQRDHGWIGKLLEEAENERMHLLTWMQLVQPTFSERVLVVLAQLIYTPCYAILYIVSPALAHKFVGYLEEEAVLQYTLFLEAIDKGAIPNIPAPQIALKYWNLKPDSLLRDVVLAVRADEAMHRDVNHAFSERAKLGLHLDV